MGEGGCSPDYFLNRMTVSETASYLSGQDRRHRQQWEQTRLLAGTIVKVLTGEDISLEFPWDSDGDGCTGPTAEELEELRAKAREAERRMNVGNL